MDNIEDKLEQLKVDVMRTECPIVIAGETSSGKSSIINLILGEKILPTGIGASTSRVCRVKHSYCYKVSTKDRRGEISGKKIMSFENSKEMAKKLQDLARTADEEISYIDIYMPVPMLQGNVMIVDTPGFGDQEQQGVAEKMMSYLPNALAFIFVLNVSNAGGIQDDRILPVLSKVKNSIAGMNGYENVKRNSSETAMSSELPEDNYELDTIGDPDDTNVTEINEESTIEDANCVVE
uniref:Dynamin N-terminal domain-containing protein n=1 Tax=Magallana gigas TaxID=29159 RepID=A0A8W8NQB9_MAGGI